MPKITSEAISRKIRFRHIRCFVAVARKKSFVLAAEDLGLTQPAVSRSIRELEQILGCQLFDRSMRGAQLTLPGKDFFEAAENSILQIRQGTNAVIGNLGLNETVRIGALPNVCSQFLPPIVKAFKSDLPDVRVQIAPGTNAELLGQLRRGESDFVIGRLSSSEDMRGLSFEALYDEALVFVVRDGHPLCSEPPQIEAILDFPMIVPTEGTIIRQELDRYLSGRGTSRLGNVIETTSSDLQRAYLSISDAVAVAPKGVFEREIDSGLFVRLDFDAGGLSGPVGLTTNPDKQLSPAAQKFMTGIRSF